MRKGRSLARAGAILAGAALALGGLAPTAQADDAWTTYTLTTPNTTYWDIYAAGSEAWVVGTVNPYPTHSTVLQHFDGTAWAPRSVPNVGDARVITGTSASDLWIGGDATAVNATAHFDGRQWTTYPVPDQWNVVQMLVAGPNDVWAVTQTPGSSPVYHGQRLIHFNGTSWHLATPPQVADYTEPDIQLSGSGTGDVWVNYSDRDGGENTLLRSSGSSFETLPSPGYGAVIVPLGADDAWASGPGTSDPNGNAESNPLHWDGRAWTPVDDGQQWTTYRPRVAATGTVLANKFEFFEGYSSVSLVRWVSGGWQPVPGISGVGSDLVLQYSAATPQSAPWALTAHGQDKSRQNIKLYNS